MAAQQQHRRMQDLNPLQKYATRTAIVHLLAIHFSHLHQRTDLDLDSAGITEQDQLRGSPVMLFDRGCDTVEETENRERSLGGYKCRQRRGNPLG